MNKGENDENILQNNKISAKKCSLHEMKMGAREENRKAVKQANIASVSSNNEQALIFSFVLF